MNLEGTRDMDIDMYVRMLGDRQGARGGEEGANKRDGMQFAKKKKQRDYNETTRGTQDKGTLRSGWRSGITSDDAFVPTSHYVLARTSAVESE